MFTSDDKLIELAILRAQNSVACEGAQLGIGFAEGLQKNLFGTFTVCWCVVIDQSGRMGVSGGLHIRLEYEQTLQLYTGIIVESDIEKLIELHLENPYESLVELAINSMIQ